MMAPLRVGYLIMVVVIELLLNATPTFADPGLTNKIHGFTTSETKIFLPTLRAATRKYDKVKNHGIRKTLIPTVDVAIPPIVVPTAFQSNAPPLASPTLETYGIQDMSVPTAFGPLITDVDKVIVIHTPTPQITNTIALTSSAQSQNSMECSVDPIWNLQIASWSAFVALCKKEASKSTPSSVQLVGRMTTMAPTTLSTHGVSGSLDHKWTPLAGTGSRATASNRISIIPGPHTKNISTSDILSPTSGFSVGLSVAKTHTSTTTTGSKSVAPSVRVAHCCGLAFVAEMLGFIIWF